MKTLRLFLFMCLILVCSAAEPAPQTKPLFSAEVTCFLGQIGSRSKCTARSTLPGPNSKSRWSSAMTCGSGGRVSEIHWEFLGSEDGADVYEVARRFQTDAQKSETVTKKIRFSGKRLIIFEDSYQVVVIDPATVSKKL